jgi:L-lactate dehydrogenase complex protein LldG
MVHEVPDYDTVITILKEQFADTQRLYPGCRLFKTSRNKTLPMMCHHLKTVDVAILKSNLAVAENGAVWITDADLPQRVLPLLHSTWPW